jgi:formylglycine-generating enzyme required for sulfatase activity
MGGRSPAWLLVVLLAASCGPSEEEQREARREAVVVEAAEKRRETATKELTRAQRLATEGKYAEAWGAWRTSRDVLGETAEHQRLANQIRKAERELRRDRAYEDLLLLLKMDTGAKTEAVRIACLRRATKAAREFLDQYPEHEDAEEIRASLEYCDSELAIAEKFDGKLTEAKDLLGRGKAKEGLAAARAALEVLDKEEARALVTRAQRALTPKGMILIPEGMFPFGKAKERIYLPAFYIDIHEVTNAEYALFVKDTGHAAPGHFKEGRAPEGKENHPVVNVTLPDALAYAAWADRRIPTEAQWERAARGTDGRTFPWGEVFDEGKGNFAKDGTKAVGSMPFDRSPDGIFDLGGNVMEMTLPRDDAAGATSGPVMKGGHWSSKFHADYARTWSRWPVDRARKSGDAGFRCVMPAP